MALADQGARARRIGFSICVGLGVAHALLFLYVALRRLSYPYDLEWMEGGQLVHSFEMLQGRFPFGRPTADHIAFPYQPLYSAIVAALGALFGLSLPLARTVSIVSTLACSALIGDAVRRETGSRRLGILAACSVLAFYGVTGFWYDLARVDSLFLALLVAGLCAGRYLERPGHAALCSAVLLVLAYKTKQLALIFFVAVPPLLYPKSRSAAVGFVLLSATLLGLDYSICQKVTSGWFGFFMYDVPRGQPYQPLEFVGVLVKLLSDIPFFSALVILGSERFFHGSSLAIKGRQTWMVATLLGIVATIAARARPGGWSNNFMTTYVFAVVPAFVGVQRIAERGSSRERALLYPLLAAQLAWLLYDPRPQIPEAADYAAGERLVSVLRASPGPVLIPDRPWIAVLAGKAPSYHSNAYWELGFQNRSDTRLDDLEQRLSAQYYRTIVVQVPPYSDSPSFWPRTLIERYRCDHDLSLPGRGLRPFTGGMMPGPHLVCAYAPNKTKHAVE